MTGIDCSECIEWEGGTSNGYGRLWHGGVTWYAHRLAYVEAYGEIPDGMQVDHLCRNRRCINPEHLEAVSQQENIHRAGLIGFAKDFAARTTCKNGHPFDGHNGRSRYCTICVREYKREWARKARERDRL
jgi:hypothetical protein